MTTFLLIRHGEPDWRLAAGGDLKGAAVGWAAHIVPLTETGIHQIEKASDDLEAENYQLVISSPMTRALQSGRHHQPQASEFRFASNSICTNGSADGAIHWSWSAKQWPKCSSPTGEWPPGEARDWNPLSSVRRARLPRNGKTPVLSAGNRRLP